MIERGNAIPSVGVKLVNASGIAETTSDAVLGSGTVVLFAVPGAFTPTEGIALPRSIITGFAPCPLATASPYSKTLPAIGG